MHGCPCGFHGDPTRECRCTPGIIQRYLSQISGPMRHERPEAPPLRPRRGRRAYPRNG
ncbi:MAG: ATP-binding protein, partial [Acidobacteriota bacterium]